VELYEEVSVAIQINICWQDAWNESSF